MSSRSNCWTDLNEALLDKIIALVCSPHEASDTAEVPFLPNSNLPLVCRRFCAAYKSSPTLWRRVSLDWLTAINPPGVHRRLSRAEERNTPHTYNSSSSSSSEGIPRFGYICRWLLTRAPLIQHLTLTNCHVLGPALELQLLPLCAQANPLISIQLLDCQGSGDEILAALSTSSSLRHIKITCYQPSKGHTVPLRVSGTALQALNVNLKSLEDVDLEVDSLVRSSSTIEEISWSSLQTLRSVRLSGRMESVVLQPDMLSALSNLQNLELVNVRLPQFSPAMVNALSSVSYLSLTNILAAKPRRKSGFALWNALPGLRSLKNLVIVGAGRDAEVPRSALACSLLESLTLQDCTHVGNWPLNTTLGASTTIDSTFPALDTLQTLNLIDIGLSETPSRNFWRCCKSLTSLTWRNVHHAAPRHRFWDHQGACGITDDMEPVLRMLRVLRLEYSGMQRDQFEMETAHALHAATKLKDLSLEGNRFAELDDILNGILVDKMELERLSLVNCGLEGVPTNVFSLSSLTELDLRQNLKLKTLRDEDIKLKKIKVVKRNDRQAMLDAALPKVLTQEESRNQPSLTP